MAVAQFSLLPTSNEVLLGDFSEEEIQQTSDTEKGFRHAYYIGLWRSESQVIAVDEVD